MGAPLILASFAAGELSPSLYGRVDLEKWHAGAALLENFFVDYRGGVANRPGTKFIGDTPDSSLPSRLIPFIFSSTQAYVLLFSHRALKVIYRGGFVQAPGGGDLQITSPYNGVDLALLKFTQSADVMTLTHPNYAPTALSRVAADNWVFATIDFTAKVQSPANVVAVPFVGGATTTYNYVVTALGANGVTESLPSAPGSTALAEQMSANAPEHITVTWDAIPGVKLYNVYRQPEVPGGAPAAGQFFGFVGTSETNSFVDANIAPDFSQTPPQDSNPFATVGNAGTITGLNVNPGANYSMPMPFLTFNGGGGVGAAATIDMHVIQAQSLPFNSGSGYVIGDVVTLVGGGFNRPAQLRATAGTAGGVSGWAVVDPGDYTDITPPLPFNLWGVSGGSGIGATVAISFGIGPAIITNPGSGYVSTPTCFVNGSFGGGWIGPLVLGTVDCVIGQQVISNPSCSCYYQQRQAFAATLLSPDTFWLSKTADFLNFGFSQPARPDDSIVGNIAAQQVNAIKHLVPLQSLIALSSAGAWKIDAGPNGGAITPSSIEALPQVFNGASDVRPLVIGRELVYVQSKGSIVRDLSFNVIENVYNGNDMTTLANHLFYGHQIVDWDYAEEPFKIVWAVREDGTLLSFTFLKEQNVYAWAHHTSVNAKFKNVCVIPEDNEDAVYVIVDRQYFSGFHLQFVERMASRNMGAIPEKNVPADLSRAWFLDAALQYPLNYPAAQLAPGATYATLSIASIAVVNGGGGFTSVPQVVITDETGINAVATAVLTAGVVTSIIVNSGGSNFTNPVVTFAGGGGAGAEAHANMTRDVPMNANADVFDPTMVGAMLRANSGWGTVRVVVNARNVIVNMQRPLTDIFPAASGQWSCTIPVNVVSGLHHLEGQEVGILADGSVVGRQNVSNGTVTLDNPASAIVVGLPYEARFQSLYNDIPGEQPTVQGRRKKISAATARVQDSRGLELGHDFKTMVEVKDRSFEVMGEPVLPFTGDRRVVLPSAIDVKGQVCVRQRNPLPATLLALIPEVTLGDQ